VAAVADTSNHTSNTSHMCGLAAWRHSRDAKQHWQRHGTPSRHFTRSTNRTSRQTTTTQQEPAERHTCSATLRSASISFSAFAPIQPRPSMQGASWHTQHS
jgi:hypothetical protein